MSEPLVIVIPGWTPDYCLSLNRRRNTHWRKIREAQNQARWNLWAVSYGRSLPYWDRVRVTIGFLFSVRRRRDVDGLVGLAKPLIDGLVELEIIPDDDSEHLVALTVVPSYEKGMSRTTITVEEVL